MFRLLSVVCFLVLAATNAHAATMTFTGVPTFGSDNTPHVEDGITADGGFFGIGSFAAAGTAHMDSDGAPFTDSIIFTMAGSFDAVSFDILPIGGGLCNSENEIICGIEYDSVLVEGFTEGNLVASDLFNMGNAPNTYLFGTAFRSLTSLKISILVAETEDFTFCENSPCSHMNIDNVTLTPVPLPPALLLMIGSLGLLAAVRSFGTVFNRLGK